MNRQFDLSKIPTPSENILDLPEPSEYSCRLWRYYAGHSMLVFRVAEIADFNFNPFFIVFENVQYFETKMNASGANICIASLEDCFEMMKQIKMIPDDETQFLLPLDLSFRLFTIETGSIPVRILSNIFHIMDDLGGYS